MDIEKDYNNIEILPSEDGRYYLEYRLYTYGSEPQYHVSQDTLTFRCIQNPQTQMNVAGFHGMEHKRHPRAGRCESLRAKSHHPMET